MQIYSANSFTPQATASLAVDKSARTPEQNNRLVVDPQQQKAQTDEQAKQQKQRFDVDEQAITQFEEQKALTNTRTSPQKIDSGYDQPSQVNLSAVSRYQSVGDIAQREAIQQTFGVDLYA
ncbi:hypothetical protein [Thalassotalea sp. G2M2-11]|uniref:hypothetical protein n=1 Tax=Thalassotalea sp. G2M2-11 TaxID=2787627 RepID=UPI0019D07271|nr:hypothetical protein [Thalassotalea sp. G2M2-11]